MGAAEAVTSARLIIGRRRQRWRLHVHIASLAPLVAGVVLAAVLFWAGHLGVKDAIHRSNELADAEAALVAAVVAEDAPGIEAALQSLNNINDGQALPGLDALAQDAASRPDIAVERIRERFSRSRVDTQANAERRFLWFTGIGLTVAFVGAAASFLLWRHRWHARWQRVRTLRNAVTAMASAPLDSSFEPSGADDDIGVVEEAVSRLTHDLADRLVHQQRLSLLGEQVAFVAHDIRNPLGTIMLGLSVLNPGPGEGEVHALLQDELRRATAMLEEFRGFARADDEPRPVALEHEADAAIRAARHRAVDAKVTIEADLRPACIFGRPNEVRQVLANLLENAIDAARDSERRLVRVSTVAAGDLARIAVEDSGAGVHPADRDRVFASFYTTKHGGSGMGLAICRRIIERAGGSITVDASPALGGARLVVTVPSRLDCRPSASGGDQP
ncbi:MAG: hypothetical protein Kow0010_26730 [Dehalococcoidia bacterium]